MTLERDNVLVRLQALYNDLGSMPADMPCPWPVARIYNALLVESRELRSDDPIVSAMTTLKVKDKASTVAATPAAAVRALAGQLLAALSRP